MGKNEMIKMKLTPQEAIIIENIRSLQSSIEATQNNRGEKTSEEYMEKYMDMDDNEFIDTYAEVVGDDVILSVLQDSLGTARKWEIIFDSIDEDVIDELFEAYVSIDYKRQVFLDTQDRTELCSQMVDMVMDGDWTPEN